MEKINIELKRAEDYLDAMVNAKTANKQDCENVKMHLDNLKNLIICSSSLTFKNKRKTDMEKLVSDKEIEQAFGYADFGRNATKRDILNSTLLKYASGYTTGHTAKCIALELGLITAKEKLTKKGKEYLYEAFSIGLSL